MKRFFAAALLLMGLVLGGCERNFLYNDIRSSDQIDLVRTVGVDIEDGKIVATVSMAGKEGSEKVSVLSAEADSVSEALKKMQSYSTKKYIFYGHVQELVIGEKAARENVSACIDYIERGVEMRLDTRLYVVKGGRAKDMISWASSEGKNIGALLESLEKDVQLVSESHVYSCGESGEEIAQCGNMLAAAIEAVDEAGIVSGESSKIIRSAGYAVIKQNRLVDFIDTDNARAVTIMTNKAVNDITTLPDGMGGFVTLEMSREEAEYDGEFKNGRLNRIYININIQGNIMELQNPIDLFDKSVISLLETELARLELERVRSVIEKSHRLECDFIKIMKMIAMKHPIETARLAEGAEKAYLGAETVISVKTKIRRTYAKENLQSGGNKELG